MIKTLPYSRESSRWSRSSCVRATVAVAPCRSVPRSSIPRPLPISPGLVDEVAAWQDRFDATLERFSPSGSGFAVVHLTWRRSRETAPSGPSADLHADPAALLADLTERH